ncbi:hypothetical protein [Acinetobacter soli]|uniref:hypothetical protein n=1 Tax=Acinetobacter soli TaxID=487316 RepID=UPI001D18D916|nr:hypothetical protein [Acinetobacter soli]WEH90340.1 hypothetical protein PX669_15875 [Acinetobacter soli]WEI09202.1 hypothetical protein PYR73_13020 [Acinetobacter soli]
MRFRRYRWLVWLMMIFMSWSSFAMASTTLQHASLSNQGISLQHLNHSTHDHGVMSDCHQSVMKHSHATQATEKPVASDCASINDHSSQSFADCQKCTPLHCQMISCVMLGEIPIIALPTSYALVSSTAIDYSSNTESGYLTDILRPPRA